MSSNSCPELPNSLRGVSHSNVPNFTDDRTSSELFWVKHQPFLAELGYMLRPRYHPDWHPSWIRKDGTKRWRFRATFEDEHIPFVGIGILVRIVFIILYLWQRINVLDAIRVKDGAKVVLRITQHLSSEDLLRNPCNHSIPIPDDEEKRVFMVMPRLIAFDEPEFHCRREFIEALRQLLEASISHCSFIGLDFMHSLNISHGDVNGLNFMMDYSKVCPKGYHFAQTLSYDGVHWNRPSRPRCRVGPIRYYLIDFESAQQFPDGKENAVAKRPLRCGVKSSPEFSLGLPCNPFKLDVYNAAVSLLFLFQQYHGLEDFKPLLLDMMSEDPLARPDMAEALRKLGELMSSKDKIWLRGRIWMLCNWIKPPSPLVQYLWQKFPALLPYL
ncbi:hypothetical protein EDD18DRAFT_1065378 [Armillaria luteobubalina]|uniref:Protein kinase domain-containing protein n=1 Tax=Armillaria luteobubalina TaxID=153913 RepID=A0AA39QFN3_9AGAR|nr:hypothetical protein EDD18DRAFT_1065378 [Armillaria luteobubalina]